MIEPVWGPQGRDVFERTYSRTKADGTKESWHDTVTRVVDGNLALVPAHHHLELEREDLFSLIYGMRAMPAGRHLWTTGVPGRQFNRNCHRAGWGPELSDHFVFMFNELMKGGGVGANYSSEYLEALPPIVGEVHVRFRCDPEHPDLGSVQTAAKGLYRHSTATHLDLDRPGWIMVTDSREGWCDVLATVIDAATEPGEHLILIDVSKVRPQGSPIRGFGGTASGPGPLVDALTQTADRLVEMVSDGKLYLDALDAMDIDHALASCVIAGNTRRSARMSILRWNDPSIFDFIDCKADTSKHWSTNISVEVDEEFFDALEDVSTGEIPTKAELVWDKVIDGMLTNGEPGLFNSSLAADGELRDTRCTNPCGEIALEEWESCNLGHVNLGLLGNSPAEEVEYIFGLMARFLVRATFAELTDPRQIEVEARNRRIGVGFYGFQEWLGEMGIKWSESHESSLVRDLLQSYKDAVDEAAFKLSAELGIPCPIKTTAIAPTGTIAKLSGHTEGIHPVYGRYYERRIRYAADDPALVELSQLYAIEDCIYSANTSVVVHHVRDSILDSVSEYLVESADEISVWNLLEVQAMVQECYADNAVSFTCNVDPALERTELEAALWSALRDLKGTTIFPDLSRPQSPYTRITREQYEAALDHETGQALDECSTGACPIR